MKCEDVEVRLDPYRTGEIDASERREVAAHLAICRDCASDLHDLASVAAGLSRLLGECQTRSAAAVEAAIGESYDFTEIAGRRFFVAWSSGGLTFVDASASEREALAKYRDRNRDRELRRSVLPSAYREIVEAAWSGSGAPQPHVDLSHLPEFERQVLQILTTIPKGEVRTYAWVAREAGRPGAVRAVGNSCARNPVPFVVPCHRVVPTRGGVGNYAFGPEAKRALLIREGVALEELDRLAAKNIRYLGSASRRSYCFPTCLAARAIAEEDRIYLRDDAEAVAKGFEPCAACRPLAA